MVKALNWMKQMDGLKNIGPELTLKLKLFEGEAAKIAEVAPIAVKFASNYINYNKAAFAVDFAKEHFKDYETHTITIVSVLFPLVYLELFKQRFKYSKINIITKQYTAITMKPIFDKYYYHNVEFFFKEAMFDKDVQEVFEQSDLVVMPDTDYMMPFEHLPHFKFKKCLALNFKDPHERKTNNNIVFSGEELEEICDFSTPIECGTHHCTPIGGNFFTNTKLFYAYGERL